MTRLRFRDNRTGATLVIGLVVGSFGLAGGGCSKQPSLSPEPQRGEEDRSVAPASPSIGKARDLPDLDPNDDATEVGIHGAVASAEGHATDVGLAILKRGGNAVDAAVAVGFALSVTQPSAGNIGGGGFMIVRTGAGKAVAIDYRETAPGKAHRDMFLDARGDPVDARSRLGALAAGIPGDVAGFAMAHEKFGSLPWKELVMPAVALAGEGWVLDSFHAEDLQKGSARMEKAGFAVSAAAFRRPDGSDYQAGDLWKQPELAVTLEQIANDGPHAFYQGSLADKMVAEVQKLGGIWTTEDLANYRAVEREPLIFGYRGHEVIAMPPPSAGGMVLRQILAASESLSMHEMEWDSVERIHLYVEILRRTYADRNLLLGDPDFIDIPAEKLLDVSYIDRRMSDIDASRATPSHEVGAGVALEESKQTTHFSVVDDAGMAVSNTYTLNGGFGAKRVIPGTGVILNNEMDDFTAKVGSPNMFGLVQGPQNGVEPGKRMLSSMTPTIVVKDGALRAILGSPGGPTITTTVAQILMQIVDHGRTLSEAVVAPRIHHQWLPDKIFHEASVPAATMTALRALGHETGSWSRIGHANCIEVDPATGGYRAVADKARDGGKAAAY